MEVLCGYPIVSRIVHTCICKASMKVYDMHGSNERRCCGKHLKLLLRTGFEHPHTAIVIHINDTDFRRNINPYSSENKIDNHVDPSGLSVEEYMYYTGVDYLNTCEKYILFDDYVENKPTLKYFAHLYPKFKKTQLNGVDCSICFENISSDEGTLVACEHSFHKECLQKWYVPSLSFNTGNCPNCRTFIIPVINVKKNNTVCNHYKKDLKFI